MRTGGSKKKVAAKVPAAKQYNAYLDILKGLAILFVVLGHSVQSYATGGNYDNSIVFRIIYSFHMPLFMFLSGAAAAYSFRPMNFDFLKRKFLALVIPFLAWGIVSYFLESGPVHTSIFAHMKQIIVYPDYGLWFLWALFLNFCALALIKYLSKWFKIYSYLLVWLAIYSIPTGKYGIGLVKWHLPFFAVGYLIFLHRERLGRLRNVVLGFCVIAFPLLVASWHRLYYPSFVQQLNGHLVARHLSNVLVGEILTINSYSLVTLFYMYLVPFTGIGFVYWLFQTKPAKYSYSALGFLGLYTLDIYVSHNYFLRFNIGHGWVQIISAAFSALVLSLALGFIILRRVDILNRIFLGGRTVSDRKAAKVKTA